MDEAHARAKMSLPAKVVLYRHLEQDGFKTVSIKELRIELHMQLTNFITELTDGAGKVMESSIWSSLDAALNHYNNL